MPEQPEHEVSATVAWVDVPQWQAHAFARGFEALATLFGGTPSARARAVVQRDLYGEQVIVPPLAAG